ncbi:MAG: ATP-binding protein [Acidobacteriota bacterium]|nr:ATP-binding protein [Acidobacteriota bacterium]
MFLKPQERLHLILPPLEVAFAAVQLILVPSLAVFAEVSLFNAYFGLRGVVGGDRVLAYIAAGLFLLHLALLRVPTISGGLERAIGKLERYAVLSCPWMSLPSRDVQWRPGCWLIPEEYKQPLFRYDSQQYLIERIVRLLADGEGDGARFVYVEGESGQGKTRTIFLLMHTLLKDPKLCELANRAFLYDMAMGRKTQTTMCRRLGSIEHEDALVFVDNVHRIEPEVLRDVTQKLLDTPGRGTERLVILLGQPGQAWRVRPTAEVRLISAAREQSVYLSLGGVPSRYLAEQLDGRPGGDLWARAFHPAAMQTATIAQLHFAQAVARNARNLALVRELLDLIEGAQPSQARENITRFVSVVTAVSLYRGSFTSGVFWRACWASSRRRWAGRVIDCLRMRLLLARMSRLGFTPRQSAPRAQFVFHEAMAEHCKDHLATNPAFWSWFVSSVNWRLAMLEEQHPMIRWLLSCEVHDTEAMQQTFERALLSGTLSPMVRCLDRNRGAVEHSPSAGYQYALLLDKVGRFADSRAVYSRLDARSPEESVLANRVRLARVEVEHGADAYDILSDIARQRNDVANTMAAEYWKIHLDAHRGIFRPEELIQLAEKFGRSYSREQFERSYFLVHSAARIFFDAHRHVYLSGERVTDRLARLEQLPLDAILNQHLPQYRALYILYREAHLLAHEILPNLVFLDAHQQLYTLAGKVRDNTQLAPGVIVQRAHEAYTRASDEFAVYGDREYLYLQADTLNMEMLADDAELEPLRAKLIDYNAFIEKTDFADLMSYPCFYFFRWHTLNYFRWLESGDQRYAQGEADRHAAAASDYLAKAERLDKQCGNAYGLWRTRFMRTLLDGLRAAAPGMLSAALAQSKVEAGRRGYWRDARLVESLLDKHKITPLDIKRTVSYYPFVHQ